ncbi:hypothetical protein NUW54_g3058 [Trametes sanguinea]|uniref:Uncharacterized protein n=1 Tax=Trametes sanguinea TaxID=158606 RepID=A0ACC1Q1T2_9APHY|nr:hypothetical protein NUW54_g3058 [Trametes sanguinea]
MCATDRTNVFPTVALDTRRYRLENRVCSAHGMALDHTEPRPLQESDHFGLSANDPVVEGQHLDARGVRESPTPLLKQHLAKKQPRRLVSAL